MDEGEDGGCDDGAGIEIIEPFELIGFGAECLSPPRRREKEGAMLFDLIDVIRRLIGLLVLASGKVPVNSNGSDGC